MAVAAAHRSSQDTLQLVVADSGQHKKDTLAMLCGALASNLCGLYVNCGDAASFVHACALLRSLNAATYTVTYADSAGDCWYWKPMFASHTQNSLAGSVTRPTACMYLL